VWRLFDRHTDALGWALYCKFGIYIGI
jgi:hypothetical protein